MHVLAVDFNYRTMMHLSIYIILFIQIHSVLRGVTMRRESSTFSTTLFSLLIIPFISQVQARKLQQGCSSSCGDIKNIRYPFRLKGDPATCGLPDFEISCQSNKPVLEFRSGKYYVKKISYNERIINVIDVNLANGICSYPSKSLSVFSLMFGYDYLGGATNKKYTNACFVKCSKDVNNPAYTRVPCLSGNQSSVYVYYGGDEIYGLLESCSFISMVPVRFVNEKSPSYETIRKLLDSGFDLEWSVDCRTCRRTSSYCYRNADDGFICYREFSVLQSFRYFFLLPGLPEISLIFDFYYLLRGAISGIAEYKTNIHIPTGCVLAVLAHLLCAFLLPRFIIGQITLLVYIIHKYIKKWKTVDSVEKFLHNQPSWMPKRYSYAEIIAVTNNFTEKLGQGGFGSVYKGQLRSGCFIAVKVLEKSKFSGEEFINEVSTIGRIHHVNVVQLVGFCSEGSKRALVYEYMPYASLDRYLFSKGGKGQSFGWEKLHEIALGIARGIEYLHRGCDMCILHFDIKPHNILLDYNFIPKVSDFGLAKFYPKENDFVSVSATRGTIGYIAPELISRTFGAISCKSDVYSFGMLLLEMAGGRRNSCLNMTRSSKAYFPSWVYDRINRGEDLELQNVTEIEAVLARKLCMIGLWCIQVKATDRPSMTRVVEMLEASTNDLPMPPKPFFSSSQHTSTKEIEPDSSTESLLIDSIEECSYNHSVV